MTSRDRPPFGEVLRRLRLEAGLSQDALADRARISSQAVSALERGVRRAPQSQTLVLLMDALGLDSVARAQLEGAARASTAPRIRHKLPAELVHVPYRNTLPPVASSFVGRAADCARVDALLHPGSCVTIWGSGGIGKTRLALETARGATSRFADGIWFVELADVIDGEDVVRAIATTAGIMERADRSIDDVLAEGFRGRRTLLLLDNTEHVIERCAQIVERLLRDDPSLTVLCTSREPLRIAAEYVYPLGSLPIPRIDDPDLERSPAVRLFLDRAESVGSRIDAARELQSVATICEQLDSIPLALELAAARSPVMTPAQIAHDLADDRPERLRLLTRGGRTARPRHKTLAGVLDWSVALLDDDERTVLARLSVWPGRWTVDDAVAVVCDDAMDRWAAIDAVNGLVHRSLVIASGTAGEARAYRMLHTTRTYALGRAELAGDLERCRRLQAVRVRDHLASENAGRAASSADRPSTLEMSAVRAALRWSLGLGNALEIGAQIAIIAERFWADNGAQVEALGWLREARDRLPQGGTLHIETLILIARLARDLMQYAEGYEAASRAVTLADAGSDLVQRAEARLWLALSASLADDRDRGRRLLEEALAIFDRIGDAQKRLKVMYELCALAMLDGRFGDARDYAVRLPAGFRALGMHVWAASAEINVAEIEFGLGNVAAAIDRGLAALAELRELNSWINVAITTHNLAGYFIEVGNVGAAVGYARESLEIALDRGWDTHCANAIGQLAAVLAATGDMHEAALLTGFLEHRLASIGIDYRMELELQSHRRLRERLAKAFTPLELERAIAGGAGLGADAAAALALDATNGLAGTTP